MAKVPPALVLTGFMGAGKSTVGGLVAARLGWPFLDLDERIVALSGRTISELFAAGEHAFRVWEREVLAGLDLIQPLVLATGGGTLIGMGNQHLLAGATVVVLDVPLAVAQGRIAENAERPLTPYLADLHARRAAAYARLPLHVDTMDRMPEEIAAEVMALMEQDSSLSATLPVGETLMVSVPGAAGYEVRVEAGGMAGVGPWLAERRPSTVALITDSVVGPLWGETVRHDLLAAGLSTTLIEIPAGETYKTLETLTTVYDRLLDAGLDRDGAIVALGGGVVGDLAGFAAATWLRGVRTLVQVPTTLLAMVDASIGGKTGVDHPRGKNLIGAFRAPDWVLADPTFLTTLPARAARSGMAEVLKHGLIADAGLWAMLAGAGQKGGGGETAEGDRGAGGEGEKQQLPQAPTSAPDGPQAPNLRPLSFNLSSSLLARAIRVKVDIVARDPWERGERGERAKLNLGHTFGHAYEWLSGFALTHGEAVSVGIVTAARLSEVLGLAATGLAAEIEAAVAGWGLPTRWPGGADGEGVWAAMQGDKKRAARGLRFVLPRAIGDVVVTEPGAVPKEVVLAVLSAQHAEGEGKT